MISTATIQSSPPPRVLWDYNEKAEIRSIETMFPEYNNNVSNIKDHILRIILENREIFNLKNSSIDNTIGDVMDTSYYITKNQIDILGHLYEFESGFIYSVREEDNMYIVENEFFNIFGYGETKEEAENELYIYINDLWEGYAEETEENLDNSGLILKNKLLNNIRKIK